MSESAKHDVGHVLQLAADGGIEARVIVAMQRAPPRGHAINQVFACRQFYGHALGAFDMESGQGLGD